VILHHTRGGNHLSRSISPI